MLLVWQRYKIDNRIILKSFLVRTVLGKFSLSPDSPIIFFGLVDLPINSHFYLTVHFNY